MRIKEMLVGKMLEISVDKDGYHYRFVSKVERTAENSVAVSLIASQGRAFPFSDSDDVTILYRSGERMWKWEHVKAGVARLEKTPVHTFSSKEEGKIYNRRESFRVPIGESLLMHRIIPDTESVQEDDLIEIEEKKMPFSGHLADLSVNGAGLYANEEMDIGTTIVFEMPTNVGVLSCRGDIVRKSDVTDKPYQFFYGCDFTVIRKEMERYLFERQRLMLQKERGSENVRMKNKW